MIVGAFDPIDNGETAPRTTVDDLFRRAAVRNPDAIALADPPDRTHFTDGEPRQLTYAQADRAIWAIAARLRALGLQTDSVIGVQLPNTVESVLTLLAIVRTGMVAAPLPLLWRENEIIAALSGVGAKALVTAARIGPANHAAVAGRVAAGLFSIRHVCAFGDHLPDGIMSLGESLTGPFETASTPQREGNPAQHAAFVTFEPGPRGNAPVMRNHAQLFAAARQIANSAQLPDDIAILSATPCTSLAALASVFVPWLMTGGRLVLHQPFDARVFRDQIQSEQCGALVVPGQLIAAFDNLPDETVCIALWRAPERLEDTQATRKIVDVVAFGEIGLHAAARTDQGRMASLPLGPIRLPGTPAIHLETKRGAKGTLLLRGPMVVYPGIDAGEPIVTDGFVDTNYPCRIDPELGSIVVTGPQAGMIGIGGYRIARSEIDAFAAALPTDSPIAALPDGLLGQRLRGRANDPSAVRVAARGANPLIGGAFEAPR